MTNDLENYEVVDFEGDYRPFYKYRNFQDEKTKCVEKTVNHLDKLAESKIWFASPLSFNDPFDCQIPADYLSSNQDKNRESLKGLLRKDGVSEWRLDSEVEVAINPDLKDESYRWENNCKIQRQVIGDLLSIFSLSRKVNSLLMWSHYADKHRGFAIGYNAVKFVNLLGELIQSNLILKQVDYTLTMPTSVDPFNFISMAKSLSAKHEDWRYEEEYRFILLRQENAGGMGIEFEIPTSVVESITFGLETSREDEDLLRKSISHWPEQPKFFRMKRKPYSFELDIEPARKK